MPIIVIAADSAAPITNPNTTKNQSSTFSHMVHFTNCNHSQFELLSQRGVPFDEIMLAEHMKS